MSGFRNQPHGRVCHRIELPAFQRPRRNGERRVEPRTEPGRREPHPLAWERSRVAERKELEGLREREAIQQREVELLRRRLAKLLRVSEAREAELLGRQVAVAETGLASIYSEVQGLSPNAPAAELRCYLMRRIFEANLKLRERAASIRSAAE